MTLRRRVILGRANATGAGGRVNLSTDANGPRHLNRKCRSSDITASKCLLSYYSLMAHLGSAIHLLDLNI